MTTTRPLSSVFLSFVFLMTAVFPPSLVATVWDDRRAAQPQHTHSHQTSVVIIQDIHQNIEAQQFISRLIRDELRSGADVIAVEGAAGPIDASRFRSFADQAAVVSAFDFLLNEAVVAGSIHAAFTTRNAAALVGVDDMALHQDNADAYRRGTAAADKQKNLLRLKQNELSAQKRSFNPALASFDARVAAYRSGAETFPVYVAAVARHAKQAPAMIVDFLAAAELEKTIDFASIENTRQELLAKFSPNELLRLADGLPKDGLAQAVFSRRLLNAAHHRGLEPKRVAHFAPYVRYLELSRDINAETLLESAQALERQAYATLCRNVNEKNLVAQSRRLYLTGKLLDFSLTKSEWREYQAGGANAALGAFEDFYRIAEKRDGAMADRLLSVMREKRADKGVLVAGGFHAREIEQKLVSAGVRVKRVSPAITTLSSDKRSALRVFVQAKTPLEKLFAGDTLFLAPKVWTGPQRLLAGALTVARHLWLRFGSVSPEKMRDLVADLSGQSIRQASFTVAGNGNADIRIDQATVASVHIGEGQQFTALSLAGTPKIDRWAAIRELPQAMKLFFGRKALVSFISQHLNSTHEQLTTRIQGAIALQRALWVTSGVGAIAALATNRWAVLAVPAGVAVIAALAHYLHNELYPRAQLSTEEDPDPLDMLLRTMQSLHGNARVMRLAGPKIQQFLADHPTSLEALREVLDIIQSTQHADEAMTAMELGTHLSQFAVAINYGARYINLPKHERQLMLTEAKTDPDFPGFSAGLLETLDRTMSFQMGLKYLIEYFTDENRVGPESAARAHRLFMKLNRDQVKKILGGLDIKFGMELVNVDVLFSYELVLYQRKNGGGPLVRTRPGQVKILLNTTIDTLGDYDPATEPLTEITCPICGHKHNRKEDDRVGDIIVNGINMTIAQCPKDGMMWLTPLPGETYFENLYGENYFPSHSEADTSQFGIRAFSPEEDARRNRLSHLQLREWERIGGIRYPGSLLEIGPGGGYLLEAAISEGWSAVGVDYSPYVAERLSQEKHLPVLQGTLESYAANPATEGHSVDIVAMYDLIEHVRDMDAFMQSLRYILKEQGMVVIRTPNHVGRRPRLHLIDHLSHFTYETLTLFLEEYGFEVIDAKPSGIFAEPNGRTLENITVFARLKTGMKPGGIPAADLGVSNIDGTEPLTVAPANVTVAHVGETTGKNEDFTIREGLDRVIRAIAGADPVTVNDLVVAVDPQFNGKEKLIALINELRVPPYINVAIVESKAEDYDTLLQHALDKDKKLVAVQGLLTGARKVDFATMSQQVLLSASDRLIARWVKMIIDLGGGMKVLRHNEIEDVLKAKGLAGRSA